MKELTTGHVLADIVANDGSLKDDDAKRLMFQSYAIKYEANLKENLGLTSLDLDEKYDTQNPSSWQVFLKHPSVKKYIVGFLDEFASKLADSALKSEGKIKVNEALKIQDKMDKKNSGEDNHRLLLVFLPKKDYDI